jgi:hypothetical protein
VSKRAIHLGKQLSHTQNSRDDSHRSHYLRPLAGINCSLQFPITSHRTFHHVSSLSRSLSRLLHLLVSVRLSDLGAPLLVSSHVREALEPFGAMLTLGRIVFDVGPHVRNHRRPVGSEVLTWLPPTQQRLATDRKFAVFLHKVVKERLSVGEGESLRSLAPDPLAPVFFGRGSRWRVGSGRSTSKRLVDGDTIA